MFKKNLKQEGGQNTKAVKKHVQKSYPARKLTIPIISKSFQRRHVRNISTGHANITTTPPPITTTSHDTIDTLVQHRGKLHISGPNNAPKHPQRPLRIAFFGASDITPPVLDHLIEMTKKDSEINKDRPFPILDSIDIITSPPVTRFIKGKKVTKLSPLGAAGEQYGLQIESYSPDKSTPFRTHFNLSRPDGYYDMALVFSFPRLIPPRLIDQFPMGMINIHPSLIPFYRGPSPMQAMLQNNDTSSGVSIITIEPHQFDVGKVIAQQGFDIPSTMTLPKLTKIVQSVANELLTTILTQWDQYTPYSIKQDQIMSEYNEKFSPEYIEKRLHAPKYGSSIAPDYTTQTADEVYGLYRGLLGFRSLHTRIEAKHQPDGGSVKPPTDVMIVGMELDSNINDNVDGDGDGNDEKNQNNNNDNNNNNNKDENKNDTTTNNSTTSRKHTRYSPSQYQPGTKPGSAVYDPVRDAIRVRCKDNTTILLTQLTTSTGADKKAKEIVNGFFNKEMGRFVGMFQTYVPSPPPQPKQ